MSDDRRAAILAAWTDKPESYWQAALPRFDSATLCFGRSSLVVDRGPSPLLFEDGAVGSLDEAAEVLIARGLGATVTHEEPRERVLGRLVGRLLGGRPLRGLVRRGAEAPPFAGGFVFDHREFS